MARHLCRATAGRCWAVSTITKIVARGALILAAGIGAPCFGEVTEHFDTYGDCFQFTHIDEFSDSLSTYSPV